MQRVLGFCLLSLAVTAYSHAQATPSAHRSSSTAKSAAAASSKSKTNKKAPAATSHTKAASKTGAAKTGTKGRAVSAKSRRARAKPAPSYQLHPDPERYQQIQQALADRGYFKGQVNGEWGDDSVDALKRFQADQKIDTDGKINALSLIGLGLGPKHDGTTGRNAPLPPAPESPAATPETQNPAPSAPPN